MNLLRVPISPESSSAYLYTHGETTQGMSLEAEQELVAAIRLGDERAFEALFRTYHASLCRYGLRLLGDADEADELVQQVFLKIWERRENFQLTYSLKAYLYRAVHNTGLNMIERKKRERQHQEHELKIVHQSEEALPDLRRKELEAAIRTAVAALPEQCRRVFELSRYENLKYREIADTLDISIKTVENQMGKALRVLRERLAPFLIIIIIPIAHCLIQIFQTT